MEPAAPARFVVGIDLGTTNSALAFVDTAARGDAARTVGTFPVPQLVAPGETAAHDTLPSFHYEPFAGQFEEGALRLPWGGPADGVVGTLARERGADVPGRLVVSAKSWLSHHGVDRTADLLPWQGAPDARKLPPAEVSARYLGHLRAAWNAAHPAAPLEAQDVVITIPASFDEVARELTVTAARRAGLPKIVLLEEPQAAFYAWMARRGDGSAEGLAPGQRVLVCDIGGGTTDLTLIEARPGTGPGEPVRFHRLAVGDHLILGGDNLDLALAHHVEARLGGKLEARQWATLIRRCQQAKEILLAADAPARWTIHLPAAAGARLVGGARQVELTREEVAALLLDGFLPRVGPDARPARRGFGSGFQEFGLPYAADPAVTRYVAAFLAAHGGRPDAVLFNGGFFASPTLRERFLDVLGSWYGARPAVLENERLDLAVAWGAARFG
ncbi:MAG: Hsp70 family protein, partial [Caulobacteraceae bacterium]|nr:Hsp70 family protein [Caulobacter sp.]